MKKTAPLDFSHPPETIKFWKRLVREALSLSTPTPFYIASALPVAERIAELDEALANAGFRTEARNLKSETGFRHWLSLKTQPVAPLVRWWRDQGRPIEVVSEFELRAALAEGYAPENILVNGPVKHSWLTRFQNEAKRAGSETGAPAGLSINFDSPEEMEALLPLAKKLDWRCGVRILTDEEVDPENPQFPTQFGFTPEEAVAALKKLVKSNVRVEIVQFHLRSNISSVAVYERAIAQVAEICHAAKFSPLYLDIGGGIPVRHVLSRSNKIYDGEFGLRSFAQMLRQAVKSFPGLREVWLENGRFTSASSGVLVVKILDVKERRGLRQLICDGGRTMNAMNSIWEQHALLPLAEHTGVTTLTTIYGPTCMAFDQLNRIPLPRSLQAGDHLIWMEAGAYHIPWELRFSHGHAAVMWQDERGLRMARERQSFESFWGVWNSF